ncbi:MAG TPA: FtsX-like permease family protein [Alphaproteobacteria bacterium]|nr:FtsX-like permease family protein [Alphaproteobacteria bacterium]
MARIPLQPETRAARALSLTVTVLMVALGIVALAGAIALHHVERTWQAALIDHWTVELPLSESASPPPQSEIDNALASLKAAPGILDARPIGPDEVARLLRPWLGQDVSMADLPLPTLIDLKIDPAHAPARGALEQRLAAVGQGVRIDDHGAWTRDLARLAGTGEATSIAIFATVAAIMVLTIAAAARTRLAINRSEIELLHTIGASDDYVARQFQASAFRLAVVGALIGTIVAGAGIAALTEIGRSFATLLPRIALEPLDFAALAAVPLAAILLATLVARSTALILVGRLP